MRRRGKFPERAAPRASFLPMRPPFSPDPPARFALSRRRFLGLAAGLPLGLAERASAAEGRTGLDADAEGQRLAAELRAQPPPFNTAGLLRRRTPDGTWLPGVPVRLDVYETPPGWRAVYQVFSPTGAVSQTLVVQYGPDGAATYEFTTLEPGGGAVQVRTFAGEEANLPFAGSDFWLADLGLEFLRWPRQRLLKSETRKGRRCLVLESAPARPRPEHYARVVSWVDAEYRGLLRAEAYGADGRLWKEFSIGGFKKVRGNWLLKQMEIRDARSDSRTRLEFDLEIPG